MAHVDAVVMGDLNLVWPVARAGLRPAVVNFDPRATKSRYCALAAAIPSVSRDPEGAVRRLVDLARRFDDRPVLYYSTDAQLRMISRYRDTLGPWYRLRLPDAALVETLLDKEHFQDLAEQRALPVPRRVGPGTDHPVRFPCVVKPASRIGWFDSKVIARLNGDPHKVIRVDTADHLARWTGEMDRAGLPYIVQEFVPGGDDQIFSFHGYLDESSTPLAWFVGRKVRTFPLDTGRSTCLELAHEPRLVELAVDTLRKLDYTGIVKMDFKRDVGTGEFFLLEVNARFNIWHYLGAVCGVNLPAVAHADLTGRPVPAMADYRVGVRWVSAVADVKAGLAGLRAGRWTLAAWLASYGGPIVASGIAWHDPVPILYMFYAPVRRRMRRLLGLGPSEALQPV